MRILLCGSDAPHGACALRVGTEVARRAARAVDVLVATEKEAAVCQEAQRAAADLEAAGIPVRLLQRSGHLADEVPRQAKASPYDLVIVGSRGRHGLARLLLGSTALRIVEHTPASVLVVKGRPQGFSRFLACSAAGPSSEHVIRFAGRLAQPLSAAVTVLHVMSQLPLGEDAPADELQASAEELIRRRAPEGVHLEQMVGLLTEMGVAARPVVRHGLVLDEIFAEAREGCHDLLVAGAHTTPIGQALVEDLAADILLGARISVLVVR